jgi:hypothetical protein
LGAGSSQAEHQLLLARRQVLKLVDYDVLVALVGEIAAL